MANGTSHGPEAHKAQACAEPRILARCEQYLFACSRPVGVRGPKTHDGSIITEKPDAMWAIDATNRTKLRHDHGSQFISHAFRDHPKTAGIESGPSCVRQPEGNGCVERFIRTLTEQLLRLHRFRNVAELNQALRDFAHRFNNYRIIGRIGFRTPAAHQRILRGEAA